VITLDASVVIAHLDPHDPHHQAAAEYLRRSAAEEWVIHSLNLAEVLVGGQYLAPRRSQVQRAAGSHEHSSGELGI